MPSGSAEFGRVKRVMNAVTEVLREDNDGPQDDAVNSAVER